MTIRVSQRADARNPHQFLEARIVFRAGFFAFTGQGQQLGITFRKTPHCGRVGDLRREIHPGEHAVELLFGDHGLAGIGFGGASFGGSSVLWANTMNCHDRGIWGHVIGIKLLRQGGAGCWVTGDEKAVAPEERPMSERTHMFQPEEW